MAGDANSAAEAQRAASEREARGAAEFVALAKAENAQLKRLNEELSSELAAAVKATETLVAAAEGETRAAGAEMVALAQDENKKLRSVNVELIGALRQAKRKAEESAAAVAASESRAAKLSVLSLIHI